MLFNARMRSFAALGGTTRRGVYDDMKAAVDKVRKGKGLTVNECFAVMRAHYLFDVEFCNVASGWEKGVVEKNVQDKFPVRRDLAGFDLEVSPMVRELIHTLAAGHCRVVAGLPPRCGRRCRTDAQRLAHR